MDDGLSAPSPENSQRPLQCMEWLPSYASGIDAIDTEHRALFSMYNDVVIATSRQVSQETRVRIAESLVRYATHHTNHEEGLLRRAGYPHLDAHAARHAEFCRHLASLCEAIRHGHPIEDLAHLLRGWLVGHVLHEDLEALAHVTTSTRHDNAG